jgi:putative peptide zinc metalloprotease protein
MSAVNIADLRGFRGLNGEFILDTAEGKQSYLIIASDGSQIRLTSSAYQLLQAINSGVSFKELAQRINSTRQTGKVSAEQLEELYVELIRKLNKLRERTATNVLPWGFWIRLRLVPQQIAIKVGSVLGALYQPYLFLILVGIIGASVFSLMHHRLKFEFNDTTFLYSYLLFIVSLVFHEFGHASACTRFGAQPSDIGFTIYLIYPAFYSDVSAAWRLNRWQRVVVDLGGNYFQLVIGCVFLGAYYLTHWEPFRLVMIMIISAALFSLNPIFKFDGYWVLADMLGVTNLAKQPIRLVKHFYNCLAGRTNETMPWPKPVTAVLILYSLVSIGVWGAFLWKVLPTIWHRLMLIGPQLALMSRQIGARELPRWAEIRMFLVSIFFLVITLAMLWRMAAQLVSSAYHKATLLLSKSPQAS